MTISEIAKEAGVSVATVSRFMNNGPVKEETRRKLEQIVLKLNYVPESFTRRIINQDGKIPSIAVITHSMSNLYSSEFTEVVSDSFSRQGGVCYTLCCTNPEEEYRTVMDVVTRGITGAILHDPAESNGLLDLYNRISQRLPLVIVHSFPADLEFNSITVNQEKGMRDAMAYLLGLGHRRIAYVSGAAGFSFTLKRGIWKEEIEKAGGQYFKQDDIVVERPDFGAGVETTHEAVLKYLKDGNRPTAIFTANDIMALGVIAALNDMGLRVPEDVSLMSHDNTLLAKSYNLTCVDMKIKSVAIAAMDLMEYALHGSDSTPRHVSITPSIVVRKSCRQI
jgi:DNA-binding LacI/PurR family transcriptional regulator